MVIENPLSPSPEMVSAGLRLSVASARVWLMGLKVKLWMLPWTLDQSMP